jgi:hypothetical protein
MAVTEFIADRAADAEAEALFEQARRRRRRRWLIGWVAVLVVTGVVVSTVSLLGGGRSPSPASGTSSPLPSAASTALSWAHQGLQTSFVATYRLTGNAKEFPTPLPTTVVIAQRGPLASVGGEGWIEPGLGEWSYLLEWPNGERAEMVKRTEGLYSCARPAGKPWFCQGPDRFGGGNGILLMAAAYEPVTQYQELQQAIDGPPADKHVTSTSAVIAGHHVRCFMTGPSRTWCLTRQGLFVSFPTDVDGGLGGGLAGALVSSETTVPARQFRLPVKPTRWTGGEPS